MDLKLALKVLWKVALLLLGQLDEEQKAKFKPLVDVADDLSKKVK